MPSFKFHLVTVIGIFLALAVGIIIGSTFSEETIILQQRNTIESMRENLSSLSRELFAIQAENSSQTETLALFSAWLGTLSPLYLETNPLPQRAVLIHGPEFDPESLGSYFNTNVICGRLELADLDAGAADTIVRALVQGEAELLAPAGNWQGELSQLDYVFMAPDAGAWPAAKNLAAGLVNAEIPVVGLAAGNPDGLAELVCHPLFSSVAHFDTPLAVYCLAAVLRGQTGHYGNNALLPGLSEP